MLTSSGPGGPRSPSGTQNQAKGLRNYPTPADRIGLAMVVTVALAVLVWTTWLVWAFLSPPPEHHGEVAPTSVWTTGGSVTSLAFSPDGQLLAIGLRDGSVQLRRVSD